jgi:hypothetical protein
LARDCHLGFPEFGQFYIAGFPASTQVFLKSAAYAIPPRPRGFVLQVSIIVQPAEIYTSVPGVGCADVVCVLNWFCFFFGRGRILLISAASRLVFM